MCAQLLSRAVDVQDRARRLYAQLQPAARADEGHPVRTAPLHLRRGSPSSALDHSGSRSGRCSAECVAQIGFITKQAKQARHRGSFCMPGVLKGCPRSTQGACWGTPGLLYGVHVKGLHFGSRSGHAGCAKTREGYHTGTPLPIGIPSGPTKWSNRNGILGHPQPQLYSKRYGLYRHCRGTRGVLDRSMTQARHRGTFGTKFSAADPNCLSMCEYVETLVRAIP